MAPKKSTALVANELMVVNDSPGEECRIAILQDNHLEELYTERVSSATNVGNIYKGRVVNVEPAIQAAFIDYGEGINGFLHISDLHPKYFPGEERTERVGKKIPRRDRPPIQEALRRGQEILVQVLKEGLGTKGPTLTSYLSLPGRLLVLMPDMDRVGVSRKVEDEEQRREMRKILDSLKLPDGFGFILRTAGFGETKTELKRDAAYLMRLWKVMDKRIKKIGAPCELYTESDLLIRTVRDILRPTIKAIVVDSESAFERVSMFLSVVAPRSAPQVLRYRKPVPIFHAFDIERQIDLIHSREVPLASGGRLVIDQTEALVAIDVNSGKSRSARDSETNAYETNMEAADEICRQLRLRDLGGLIVNDLIDMHATRHRKAIEERFTNNLKRDRAKATALAISDFGILEMTRQRMRPSIRKSHYMDCSHCNGRGEIKVPDHVAADAVRHVSFLLQYDRVRRVEMACSTRVASVLLSNKRRELVRIEDDYGKKIDVRVSDAIAADRVDFYAYDDRNADIDILRLPSLNPPSLDELEAAQLLPEPEPLVEELEEESQSRGRRRRRSGGPADATDIALSDEFAEELRQLEESEDEEDEDAEKTEADGPVAPPSAAPRQLHPHAEQGEQGPGGRKRRRRRRRRGAGGGELPSTAAGQQTFNGAAPAAIPAPLTNGQSAPTIPSANAQPDEPGGRRGRRRRRNRRRFGEHGVAGAAPTGSPAHSPPRDEIAFDGSAHSHDHSSNEMFASNDSRSSDAHNVRIHELAKELHVTSHDVLEKCEPDEVLQHVTTPMSSVTPEEASTIREMFSPEHGQSSGGHSTSPSAHGSAAISAIPPGPKRKRRRRGRHGSPPESAGATGLSAVVVAKVAESGPSVSPQGIIDPTVQPGELRGGRRRRRRGRRGQVDHEGSDSSARPLANAETAMTPHANQPAGHPQREQSAGQPPSGSGSHVSPIAPAKKKRRALYGAGRKTISPTARQALGDDSE